MDITPDPVATATGITARVFSQSRRELGAPFAPYLSPAAALHAATWALLRESMLAGQAPRALKETAALAVAVANDCRFCIDAHSALLHAAGAHRLAGAVLRGEPPPDPAAASIVAWVTDGGSPPEPAPEFLGTVLVNHFINRMVTVLRPGSLLPFSPLRRVAGAALSRRVHRPVPAGESLRLIGPVPPGAIPAWGRDTIIGTTYAAFRIAARECAAEEPIRSLAVEAITAVDRIEERLTARVATGPR